MGAAESLFGRAARELPVTAVNSKIREVIQARVELEPGYASPRHTHPGEEIIYVLEGSLEYQVEGQSALGWGMIQDGFAAWIPVKTAPLAAGPRRHDAGNRVREASFHGRRRLPASAQRLEPVGHV